jgi:hypothetical protein
MTHGLLRIEHTRANCTGQLTFLPRHQLEAAHLQPVFNFDAWWGEGDVSTRRRFPKVQRTIYQAPLKIIGNRILVECTSQPEEEARIVNGFK